MSEWREGALKVLLWRRTDDGGLALGRFRFLRNQFLGWNRYTFSYDSFSFWTKVIMITIPNPKFEDEPTLGGTGTSSPFCSIAAAAAG